METYDDGFKNSHYYAIPVKGIRDIELAITLIDYLKELAIEHSMPHLAGIADGVWQIVSHEEVL